MSGVERLNHRMDWSGNDLTRFCSEIFAHDHAPDLFVSEARFGLLRLLPVLSSFAGNNARIVEVGAGSCILSAYLASKGLSVTAVEPLQSEFDYFADMQATVQEFSRQRGFDLRLIRATGENFHAPGQFDIAFTINALEHMPDPLATLDNMYDSLKPGGALLAHAPNYSIPFDSHFQIVLITRNKRINGWLYRSIVSRRPAIWDGLNFIRCVDVRRHLASRGTAFVFSRTTMADSVRRFSDDHFFGERMPSWLRAAAALLRYARLASALELVPERWQSPMEVLVRKPTHSH